MAISIADTACVDPRAELADDVEVGPYCVIGPDVKVGRGTRLIAHVCLLGVTTLGEMVTAAGGTSSFGLASAYLPSLSTSLAGASGASAGREAWRSATRIRASSSGTPNGLVR